MNIRDMVVPVGCALMMVVALNYFFPGTITQQESASTFVVPREKKAYKPLNEEINFYQEKNVLPAQITELNLPWATLNFSTEGASLESADFNRESDGQNKTIRTIFPVSATERENRCLLVALQDETPFSYQLLSAQENENAHELIYASENDACVIQKTFIIDKNNPKIDLVLDIAPKSGKSGEYEPRIFFPAPLMLDLKEADVISSVVMDRTHTFAKKQVSQLDVHAGWFSPEIFGTDSRYFINALIKDDNHFTQRAYYKLEDRTRLFSILEGPAVTEKTSWKLSFYFGPKELKALAAVDNRLEKTLDYSGMLSSLAKAMLYVLNWLYKYLHNYGLAIILLTLLIQLLMLPISLRNNEEKWKKQQMEYQRELAYIEQRFKDRPDQLLAERTELIRKKGLPSFGCIIPLLIQLPLFFALSRVLSSSFELYQAPMLWIPDLSQRDPYFILPILLTVAMLAQDTKGDAQQRMTKTAMAVIFGVVTAGFSAGLALYICASRVFGFIQTKLMHYFRLV